MVDVFGQFWNMVENLKTAMPGTWVCEEEQKDADGWLRLTDHLFETELYYRLNSKEERQRVYRSCSGYDAGDVQEL